MHYHPFFVTPAKAGVQSIYSRVDSGFRRNDVFGHQLCCANALYDILCSKMACRW